MPSRTVTSVASILLAAVGSYVSFAAGTLTCHEDVGSSDVSPQLCASVGSETGLALVPLLAVGAVALLLALRVRTPVLLIGTTLVLAAEAALVVVWALVSHGTIHY